MDNNKYIEFTLLKRRNTPKKASVSPLNDCEETIRKNRLLSQMEQFQMEQFVRVSLANKEVD